jgi:vacuolar-type H+-ATPase subunit D/Vma8
LDEYRNAFDRYGPSDAKQEAAVEAGEVESDEAVELSDEDKAALESARDNLVSAFRSVADQIQQLGEETSDKLNNMPDGLQQAPTGELLQQRADGCESLADALTSAADDIEGIEAAELTAELAEEKKDECDFSEADQS